MNAGYNEYMQSDSWKAKRLQRLDLDGHKCRTCGHDGSTFALQVHHVTYEHFTNEPLDDLITLCSSCHVAITDAMRRQRYANRHVGIEFDDLVPTISTRIEVTYGNANTAVSVDIISPIIDAQRSGSGPDEQVRKGPEADFFEAHQGRRGL